MKKFIPQQPDPSMLGESTNMTPAKFGHLNTIVDEINKTSASNGTFQLPVLSTDPTTDLANGQLYYNSTSNQVRAYENGAWINL